jgi:hypothetical protein
MNSELRSTIARQLGHEWELAQMMPQARPQSGSGGIRRSDGPPAPWAPPNFAPELAAVILRRGRTDDRSAQDGREGDQAMAEQLVIELTREKETPGTVRFQEQDPDEDPKVGTLYVKKAASQRLGNPTRIRVTIEAIES